MSLILITRRHNCKPDYFTESNPLKQSPNKQDYSILENFKSFFLGLIALPFSNIPKNIKVTIKFISWEQSINVFFLLLCMTLLLPCLLINSVRSHKKCAWYIIALLIVIFVSTFVTGIA